MDVLAVCDAAPSEARLAFGRRAARYIAGALVQHTPDPHLAWPVRLPAAQAGHPPHPTVLVRGRRTRCPD
jgi:hypothetical protein